MKKLGLLMVAGVLAVILMQSEARGFALIDPSTGLEYRGPVEFDIIDWSVGRQYTYDALNDEWDPEGARAGLPDGAQSIPNATPTGGDGVEDSWGILRVLGIYDPIGNQLWGPSATEELTGIYYDFDDAYIDLVGNDYHVGSVGGRVDLYLDTTPDFYIDGTAAYDPSNRATDPWGATDGTLFLSTVAVPGVHSTMATLTRWDTTDSLSTPYTGEGSLYLNITGGSHMPLFDSDAYLGGSADFYVKFSFDETGRFLFDAKSEDPVEGHAVPEPTTLILLGTGLVGLAAIGKRRTHREM